MTAPRILIVDDDEAIRSSLSELLQMYDYQVLEAAEGDQALRLLTQLSPGELPCLVILDMMMPVMDGATFLATMEREYKNLLSQLKIVITSANAHSINVGSTSIMARVKKPFDIDVILDIAEKACGGA